MAVSRILYVDDEPGLLELGKIFLEQSGQFSVDTITSASEALTLLAAGSYDAIIADYQMPGMTGIDLLRSVRAAENPVPFILFTGRGREEVVIQALNEGADFYLQKGGDPSAQFAELSHKVQRAILQKRSERALILRESYLSAIIENQPGLLWLKDTEGRFLATNQAFARSCGIASAAEMCGKTDLDIWPRELAEKYRQDDARVIRTKEPLHVEEQISDHDIPTWFETWKMPITDAAGTVIGTTGFASDITERKEREALRETGERALAASGEDLRQKNTMLLALHELEREFAEIPADRRVEDLAAKKLLAVSGAMVATFNTYDPAGQVLRTTAIEIAPGMLETLPGAWERLTELLGMSPDRIQVPVSRETYQDISRSIVGIKKTITEISYGRIPPRVGAAIQRLAGIDRFIHIAHVIDGELYGTSVIGMRTDRPDPSGALLDSFAHIIAVSLRRQRAEDRLRESDERFREITENLSTVLYIADRATGRFSYVSPAFEKIWMQPCQSLLDDPQSFLQPVHPDDLPRLQEAIRRELAEEIFVDMDYRIVLPDGTVRWIHSRNFPIRDERGRVYRVAGLAEDITDLKRSRLALQESEEKYRLIAENTADNIWIAGMDFRIRYISPSVEKMKGFTVEEAMAMPLDRHLTPASRERVMALFREELAREAAGTADPGRKVSFESEEYCKDGSTIQVENSVTLLRDPAGTPTGILGISRDITGRKRAGDAIRLANRKLRILTGITRHDILNKVAAAQGYLSVARMRGKPDADAFLEKTEAAIAEIREQVLFTRLYQDLGTSEPRWQDVDAILPRRSVPAGMVMEAEVQRITLLADPMLEKVFFNLLDNTIRHGGRVSRIRVSARQEGEEMAIVWEDDGAGIPAAEKERIFVQGVGKNTGLGLFLAREILGLTGISITETGEPGRGARFVIRAPKGTYRVSGE